MADGFQTFEGIRYDGNIPLMSKMISTRLKPPWAATALKTSIPAQKEASRGRMLD